MQKDIRLLRILHFNDVYDIQPKTKTKTAGAYYFKAHLDRHRTPDSLVLFSGDAFSPSILSNIFMGYQMVHCLNTFGVDVACFGNHEFDFDIDHTIKLSAKCNFPWLLGNLIDLRTEKPLGNGRENVILERDGLRIGVFGVAEEEWLSLLTEDYQGQLEYIDFVKYSRYQTKELRSVYKCNLVIALTHMRVPNDQILAREVPDLDFILGGHDHTLHNQMIGKTHLIKTGCNFNNLNVIDLYPPSSDKPFQGQRYSHSVELIDITGVEDYDQSLKEYVDEKLEAYQRENEKIVGYTLVPLETRFSRIRRKETNYGNFLTDLIRAYYDIDAVTIQSGSIRMDAVIEPGPLKYSTVSNIFDDYLVVKLMPGKILFDLLEHAVSKYPAFEGRFMMVSGVRFIFDALLPAYARVIKDSVTVGSLPLDYDKVYKVAVMGYVGKGGDGFTFVADCVDLIDCQVAIKLTTLITKFYNPPDLSIPPPGLANEQLMELPLLKKTMSSRSHRIHTFIKKIDFVGDKWVVYIEPTLDGRIQILNEVPDQ